MNKEMKNLISWIKIGVSIISILLIGNTYIKLTGLDMYVLGYESSIFTWMYLCGVCLIFGVLGFSIIVCTLYLFNNYEFKVIKKAKR